jgi:hypothetical protein
MTRHPPRQSTMRRSPQTASVELRLAYQPANRHSSQTVGRTDIVSSTSALDPYWPDPVTVVCQSHSGLHLAPHNIFDFRVSRHRDGPDDFFQHSRCKVQGDCFSGTLSVVLKSDQRLEFGAC